MKNLEKALGRRLFVSKIDLMKAKYIKREGTKGKYKYTYKIPKGRAKGDGNYKTTAGEGDTREENEKRLQERNKSQSEVKLPWELKPLLGSLDKDYKKQIMDNMAAGWKPRSLKEYENKAIENAMGSYESMDPHDISAIAEGMAEKEDISTEEAEDLVMDMSPEKLFEYEYDSKEKFLKENREKIAVAITDDVDAFVSDIKNKQKESKFHEENPHIKGFLEHSGHKAGDYKPEQLKAINDYIEKSTKSRWQQEKDKITQEKKLVVNKE